MQFNSKRAFFGDLVFDFSENVYEPSEDTFLFAENVRVQTGAQVLDMGTGCGILGILAAKKATSVVAVDLNPYAIHCTKENSTNNDVRSKMDFIQADLFTALNAKATFDLILFNAPYLPSDDCEATSWIGRSWAGGIGGRKVIDRFISQVLQHLKPSGRVLLMQSTLTNAEETIDKFQERGLKATVIAERKLPFFETLTLIEAKASV